MFLNYIKRSFITMAKSTSDLMKEKDKELLEKLKEAGIEAAPFTYDETIHIADARNLASKASPHKINENEGIIVDKIQESAPPPKIDLDVSDRIQDDIGEIDVGKQRLYICHVLTAAKHPGDQFKGSDVVFALLGVEIVSVVGEIQPCHADTVLICRLVI